MDINVEVVQFGNLGAKVFFRDQIKEFFGTKAEVRTAKNVVELTTEVRYPIVSIDLAQRGAKGESGVGISNSSRLTLLSDRVVKQYRFVALTEAGFVVHASVDFPDHIRSTVGVSLTEGLVRGDPLEVVTSGLVTNPEWNFEVGRSVFLGSDGEVTQKPAGGDFNLPVGFAVSETNLFVKVTRGVAKVFV